MHFIYVSANTSGEKGENQAGDIAGFWYKIRSFLSKQGVFFQQIAGPSILWLRDFFNGGCITHVITRLLGSNEINYLIAAREVGMTMSAPTQRRHDILFKRVVCRRNVAPSFILRHSMALI